MTFSATVTRRNPAMADMATVEARFRSAFQSGGTEILDLAEQTERQITQGQLRDELNGPPGSWATTFRRELQVSSTHVMGIYENFSQHGYYTEHGRGPGKMPPHERILQYLQRHGDIDPEAAGWQVQQFVYNVRKKIARDGTKPGHRIMESVNILMANPVDLNILKKHINQTVFVL